ncbi:MAG: methylated-DNA--[protein]-cysteine S-methyltransferase [Gaiellales bacterium]
MMDRVDRLIDRAQREGLVDVAYATVDAPIGRLIAAATPRGLVRLAFASEPLDDVLAELAERLSPRVLEAPARLDLVRRELDEYFSGRRHRFDLDLDWALSRSGFTRRVLHAAQAIPYGQVETYREVAGAAGNPRAVRAAGSALGSNPIPIVVPCHRVVRTGGALGGYGGGLERKSFLLELEGATTMSMPS